MTQRLLVILEWGTIVEVGKDLKSETKAILLHGVEILLM